MAMKAMKAAKAAAPPRRPKAMKAMKAMKAAKAAAPPRRPKAMKAMKAMKAVKKSTKKLESWMSNDTRDVPLVWVVAKWDGNKLTQEILHKDKNAKQVIF